MENMKFTLDEPKGDYVFSNYGIGLLAVNDQPHHNSLIIFPDTLLDWDVQSVANLEIEHFQIFIDRKPDIVILGTGARQEFPSTTLRRGLLNLQIQLDVMDTAAACRTYNLLVSEDRNVGAAVIVCQADQSSHFK